MVKKKRGWRLGQEVVGSLDLSVFYHLRFDLFQLVSYKWTTTLPTNTVVNETAYLAESKNVLLMKSRDRDLKDQGYDKSTTLVDFGSVGFPMYM